MILVVTSPDSISINMFADYVAKNHLADPVFVNLNGLVSEDTQAFIAMMAVEDHPGRNMIFRHKTRRRLLPNKVPKALVEKADCVIGFDLFSNHAEVVKSCQGWTDSVVSAYHAHIDKENAAGR